jgi:hypothetical protein
LSDAEWKRLWEGMPDPPLYLSLHRRRGVASGAFDWPLPQRGLKALDAFYEEARSWPVAVPVAFPRFHDIYKEAKVRESYGRIADDAGRTFAATLRRGLLSGSPVVQIATWNDWGEGTMVEPSAEFGDRDLQAVQRLRRELVEPGFPATAEDLRLPLRLFRLRKGSGRPPQAAATLDEIAHLLASNSPAKAREALDRIETRLRRTGEGPGQQPR